MRSMKLQVLREKLFFCFLRLHNGCFSRFLPLNAAEFLLKRLQADKSMDKFVEFKRKMRN